MKEIGSYDAKTHLPEILRAVEKGETYIITRRGKPVARIIPPEAEAPEKVQHVIDHIRERRKSLPKMSIQEITSNAANSSGSMGGGL